MAYVPAADSSERPSHADDGSDARERSGWWGYQADRPQPRSVLWLVEQGMLDLTTAAFLGLAVEARRSLIVVATPHGAGKTTLLTALLDFLPPGTQPIYLRGWYERFEFCQHVPPDQAYLLCNEISAHLPIYLWGRGVRRVFALATEGYPLATTMHADSAEAAFAQLSGYPLEVPSEDLCAIDLVVTIDVGYAGNKLLRRVTRIERVRVDDGVFGIDVLADRQPLRAELDVRLGRLVAALAAWYACPDDHAAALLARRERDLSALLGQGIVEVAAVQAALARLHDQRSISSGIGT